MRGKVASFDYSNDANITFESGVSNVRRRDFDKISTADGAFGDVVVSNPGLLVHILTGHIAGLSSNLTEAVLAGALTSESIGHVIAGSEWLGLSAEKLAQAYVSMYCKAEEGQQELLKSGVVQWAKAGGATAHDALIRLKVLCYACNHVQAQLPSGTSQTLLNDLSSRLLEAYGEDALPAVEMILTERIPNSDIVKTSELKEGEGAANEPSLAQKRCRRHADPDEDAFLEAAVHWGRPHLKRLRTSENWPSARPAALAALLRPSPAEGEDADGKAGDGEMKAAASAWTSSVTLQSVLEALGHLGTSANPTVFQALLGSAKEKAATLEQHNASLGGSGLRDALEAQCRAEAKASEAEAEAARQIRWNDEFRAKIGSLIAEPRPKARDADLREATAGA